MASGKVEEEVAETPDPSAPSAAAAAVRPGKPAAQRTAPDMRKQSVLPVQLTEAGKIGLSVGKTKNGGTLVKGVETGSQGDQAGIRPGDVVAYPGTGGDVPLPYDFFLTLCKCGSRPLSFDILRRLGGTGAAAPHPVVASSSAAPSSDPVEIPSAEVASPRPAPSSSSTAKGPSTKATASLSKAKAPGSPGRVNLPVAVYPDGSYSSRNATQEEIQREVKELMELGRQEEEEQQQRRRRGRKPKKRLDESDPKTWPRVKRGDWDYVYITGPPPLGGRFGYYDDHEGSALVYFGQPLLGDGPYSVNLARLRKPPKSQRRDQRFFSY